jgi:hypothetical protein
MEFLEVLGSLKQWEKVKNDTLPSGTAYIGPTRLVPGFGHTHRLYAPLSIGTLTAFLVENPAFTRFSYWSSLSKFNGGNLFFQSLALYGVHKGQTSSLDLPFNILTANFEEWGRLSGPDKLLIGGANFGPRSVRYVEQADNSILAIESDLKVSFAWSSFEVSLRSELDRLVFAFDDDGEALVDLRHEGFWSMSSR